MQMVTATLKYDYASQSNKLALMTNILGYVSMLSNTVLFPNQYFIYPAQVASSSISLI
jgi:hypothetical protein